MNEIAVLAERDDKAGRSCNASVPGASLEKDRLLEGGLTKTHCRVEWPGMRVLLKSVERSGEFVATDLLSGSHILIMGIDGKPQTSIIEAEGLPRWKGIKGQGRSSFWAAGRRMRSWQDGESSTVMALFFDANATEQLLHDGRTWDWQSRTCTDEAFIAVNATELANALQDNGDDLAPLRAQTIATSLQLYSARRFANLTLPLVESGDPISRAIDLIHASLPRAVSLDELVACSGLPRGQLLLGFRSRTKQSPHQYIIRERLFRAKALLVTTERPLAEIARDIGCANTEHLGQMFRQHLGMSPRAWRQKQGLR